MSQARRSREHRVQIITTAAPARTAAKRKVDDVSVDEADGDDGGDGGDDGDGGREDTLTVKMPR
jgi:hypothetical protein